MVAGADDALGLLPCGDGAEPPAKKAKNENLRHWELAPAQLLNPMGQSGVGKITLPSLWTLLCEGGDRSKYFCNLCSEDPVRRRVGLSQLSEVMVLICNKIISDKVLGAIVQPELLKEVKVEATALLPHFTKLNQGKLQGQEGKKRLKSAAYYNEDVSRPANEELDGAAAAVHAWLAKSESKLRAVIAGLSTGGLFFVGQCHEKAARAFVHVGGGSAEAMKTAAKASGHNGLALAAAEDDSAVLGGA